MSKSLISNVIAKITLELFNTLLPIILVPYVYRVLGRDSIGNVEYTITLYSYFAMLGMMGIYNYGLRSISSNRSDLKKVKYTYKNLFCIGLISNTLSLILYVLFLTFIVKDETVRLIGYIYCGNLVAQLFYVEWVNEAFEEFKFITIKTVCIRLVSVICIFIFVRSSEDFYIYVTILTVVGIINYLISYIYAQRIIKLSFRETFSGLNLKVFIIPLLIILVLRNTGILYTIADRTMLGYYKGTSSVALFSIGQKIVEMAKALVLSVVFATLPRLAFYLNEDKIKYQDGLKKLIRLVIMIVLPVGIGLFMLSPQTIWLMGGNQYSAAIPSMRIFSLRIITLAIESIIYNQILFLHKKEGIIIKYNLACGLLNVILNFIFLSILSPLVAILTTWFSELIFQGLCILYIRNNLNVSIGISKSYNLKYLITSLLFIPIVLVIRSFTIDPILLIILSFISCATIYIFILWKSKDEMFNTVCNRILKLK